MRLLNNLKTLAKKLKSEIQTLYFVARHPKTPWYAKLFIAGVVAYALSPIDLIPDFIPILGYLDDLLLLPLGIALAIKMVPASVLAECRARTLEMSLKRKSNFRAGIVIVLIWLGLAALVISWVFKAASNGIGVKFGFF